MGYVIFFIVFCIAICLYIGIDNYRVKVAKQNVLINSLPKEFDGYKILQISDLHSRDFGKTLYNKINKLDYDIIVFTGDILNNHDFEMEALINLVKHITKKTPMLYVDGNNGPVPYYLITGKITEFGRKIESIGIKLLVDTYVVQNVDKRLVFSNFDFISRAFFKEKTKSNYSDERKKYLEDKLTKYSNDTKIGLAHYPAYKRILKLIASKKDTFYYHNLILAGHYHGGQIRIPFYGAIYIPAETKKESFFPNQKYVSGLVNVEGVNQYVSRGLGSTKSLKPFYFRVFNTPEINVITLKSDIK